MTADRPATELRTAMDALKELTEAAGVMLAAEDYQSANERRLLRAAVAAQAFIEAEAAQGAAPRAEGLDVERLAKAMRDATSLVNYGTDDMDWRAEAEVVAAEYARLSRPSDERDGEGE